LKYYKDILSETKKTKWTTFKLLILGQEAVGKTSLVFRLTEKYFLKKSKLNPNTLSTNGIDMISWEKDNLTIRIFDFGGQEIFYLTHTFF
jgi:GTPase SAR1 family protein